MDAHDQQNSQAPRVSISLASGGILLVSLSGLWRLDHGLPPADAAVQEIESKKPVRGVAFDASGVGGWDSGLLTFLMRIFNTCSESKIPVDRSGLPEGIRKLITLATAVPERKGAKREDKKESFFARVGSRTVAFYRSVLEILNFLGESSVAFLRLLGGKASFRWADLWLMLRECGGQALPIVSLISALVGLILAFVGAIQLKLFGAQVYVADIVAIAIVRVMGAIMTGIIMAGRTGAAFAAQLIVGVGMLGINPIEYLNRTREALTLTTFWIGLFHSAVFGVLIALAGCLRGMQCGRSASDVGNATTSAVVTSIVSIIVATAVITFLCEVVGI